MNKILNDLSGKIESSLIRALLEVKKITDALKIDFFLVGATARDIVMQHLYKIRAPRMTKDIDIAVCVANWEEYRILTDTLLSKGEFLKGDQKQRYVFKDTVIDFIPFGEISGPDNAIRWPPDHDTILNTVGFMDVYKNSMTFRLSREPVLEIKLASIPGLAIMKLLAWKDDPSRQKDATDLLFIMQNYQAAGIEDRLYEKEISLLQEEEFDNELAGIRLLGRDMARISNPETEKALMEILISETGEISYKLVSQMSGVSDRFDSNLALLEKLKQGFIEGLGH
jgi:predicted nucleotidyltransferase